MLKVEQNIEVIYDRIGDELIPYSITQLYINGRTTHKIKLRNMTNSTAQGDYTTLLDLQTNYPSQLDPLIPSGAYTLATTLIYQSGTNEPETEFINTTYSKTFSKIAEILEPIPEEDLSIHVQTIVTEE